MTVIFEKGDLLSAGSDTEGWLFFQPLLVDREGGFRMTEPNLAGI
jgi:hypothetical protein